MKLNLCALLLILLSCNPAVFASQRERAKKWNFDAEASLSVVPGFVQNNQYQQYALGVSVGRTLTPFFRLGVGASYLFNSGWADCLPVWISPRVYFSRKESSLFLDLKLGKTVYAPVKELKESILVAESSNFWTFSELTVGYQIREHLMLGVYGNVYGEEVKTKNGERLSSELPYAIGLKLGYEF